MEEVRSKQIDEKFCTTCGSIINIAAEICPKCGVRQPNAGPDISEKSWVIALLLAFFLGGFGIHRFYVGKVGSGFFMLLLGLPSLILGFFAYFFFAAPIILAVMIIIDLITILFGRFKDSEGKFVRK